MQPTPSKLPLLLGILLIIAAPIVLVAHFIGAANQNRFKTESEGIIVSKQKIDTAFTLNVEVNDISQDDHNSSNEDEIKDELVEMVDSLSDESDKKSEEHHMHDMDEKKSYTDALQRKTNAEIEEKGGEVIVDSEVKDETEKQNGDAEILTLTVSKTDFDHYKVRDTVDVRFDRSGLSEPMLLTPDTKKKKKNEDMNWFIIAGILEIAGVALVIRSRKRKSQTQELDTLSSLPTVYSTTKKPGSTDIGPPKGPF
jgi:hypothetical protein